MSTKSGGATAVRRKKDVGRVGVFGRYLQGRIETSGLSQEQIAARAGISSGYMSRLVSGAQLPSTKVVVDLAGALNAPPTDVWTHAASAAGHDVSVIQTDLPVPTDEQLLRELARRLRDCAPVIEPLRIIEMPDEAVPQLSKLMRDLRADAIKSTGENLPHRSLAQNHLADYLQELFERARRERAIEGDA